MGRQRRPTCGFVRSQAMRRMKDAADLDPRCPAIASDLSIMYIEQSRFDDAVKLLAQARRLDPEEEYILDNQAWALGTRGEQRMGQLDFGAAIRDLERAVELVPKDALYAVLLAWAYACGDADHSR